MIDAPAANGVETQMGARDLAMASKLTRGLEAAFRKIERERMSGVPILNPALRVAATGMRPFSGAWLSVLVTPWFINLMLLPGSEEDASAWSRVPAGTKLKRQLPAGAFEFICGAEDGIGPYQMCSLFSPVLEFENQDAAMAAAEAALAALFDAGLHPSRNNEEASAAHAPAIKEETKLSRRDLFAGVLKERDERAA